MTYIVIGNSAAGLFAVEEIRRQDKQGEIIVLTAEQEASYSRCLMTYFLAGDIPRSRLYLRNTDFADRLKLKIIYGTKINSIDPQLQIVRSADGQEWGYDKLLLAMGSSAQQLTVPGGTLPEVFTLRKLKDALAINKVLGQGARKAIVIGGGLVGLKSAYALKKRGLEVTVIVSSQHILSQMLDSKAAGIIQNHLNANGIKILFQTEPLSITGNRHVQGVLVKPQSELAADLIIVGKGVYPNVEALNNCGFKIGRGLRVDSSLATNLPNIYAAGDITETWDLVRRRYTVNATWPNAAGQGRIAGANMCGKQETYPGSLGFNSVDFFGLSAVSVGITKLQENMDLNDWNQTETLPMTRTGLPNYGKLLWQGDLLKGFVLVGDTTQCGILTALIKAGRPLTQTQKKLALGKRGTLAVGMIKNA